MNSSINIIMILPCNDDKNDGNISAQQRGRGYTIVEDYAACKAFIAASEDSIKGTSQKGKEFKNSLHANY
jgi:hypothetical protein